MAGGACLLLVYPPMTISSRKAFFLLAAALVVGGTFLLYSGIVRSSFNTWDDRVYVYRNVRIQTLSAENIAWIATHPYFYSWTPLTLLSHAIDYALWQDDARGHHLSGVILHSLDAGMAFLLCLMILALREVPRATDGDDRPLRRAGIDSIAWSAFAAMLFFWHPQRVESVASVSDRKDLLCTFFLISSTLAYLGYRAAGGSRRGRVFLVASALAYVFALLSKSTAVMWPPVLVLLDIVVLQPSTVRARWRTLLAEKLLYVVPAGLVGVATLITAQIGAPSALAWGLAGTDRLLLPLFNVSFYVAKFVWPSQLTLMYQYGSSTHMPLYAAATVLISLACVILLLRRAWHFPAAWGVYIMLVLPTAGVLASAIQPTSDRYAYIPMLAFLPLVGGAGVALWRSAGTWGLHRSVRLCVVAAAAATLAGAAGLTLRQTDIWKDNASLWKHVIATSPDLPFPYNDLGLQREEAGDLDSAAVLYQKALSLKADYPDAHLNMGNIYLARGDTGKAIAAFQQAIRLRPAYDLAYYNLGLLYEQNDRLPDARGSFEKAVMINPDYPSALYGLGVVWFRMGDTARSMEYLARTLDLNPRYAPALYMLGVVRLKEGATASAVEAFQQSARLGYEPAQRILLERNIDW
jgi:Tfp pilus assembly protein PilF